MRRPDLRTAGRALWREPWRFLVPIVLAQWLATLALALVVHHNGWLYYQGGDQIYYYTTGWLVGHGHLPATPTIGFGWSYLLVPITWIFGQSFVAALPVIVLIQVVLLQPIAIFCIYGIASRIAGRLIGYLAAAVWIGAPFLAIPFFVERYHDRWTGHFLPHAFGLTAMSDYPATVLLLAAALLIVRAWKAGAWVDGAGAGVVTGLAIGFKPSNFLFLPAPLLALAVARRWRSILAFAVSIAPLLVTLTLWKYRGLGTIPAFSSLPGGGVGVRLAAGSVASVPGSHYIHLDWAQFWRNKDQIREFFWSVRVVEWIAVAGMVALARRSIAAFALVGVWFLAYIIGKGTTPQADVPGGGFWRLMLPAAPAFALLAASIPVLLPKIGPRVADRFPQAIRPLPRPRTILAAAGVVSLLLLLGVLLPARIKGADQPAYLVGPVSTNPILTPVDASLGLRVTRTAIGEVKVEWKTTRTSGATHVFYRVLRAPQGRDMQCDVAPRGADQCFVLMDTVATTRGTSYVDHLPPGRWTYRVGVAANWIDDPTQGDIYLLSPPVLARR